MAYIRKTTPQFVEEAQCVHEEKFDYSEVEYVNTHTPVKIEGRKRCVDFRQDSACHFQAVAIPSRLAED